MIKNILGVMSGSSLDGLDLALVTISYQTQWKYNVIKATTINYSQQIIDLLTSMQKLPISQYLAADRKYTQFICDKILDFIKDQQVDLISSHGHTIFHQPQNGFTLQCGDPVMIAALTKIDTVGNFRSLDVYRGGQGAPLVPYGSELFSTQDKPIDVFLNLGGICNIDAKMKGWDIGFCNMFSNMLAEKVGMKYDEDGKLGQKGIVNKKLLEIFRKDREIIRNSKSFGREHFDEFVERTKSQRQEVSVNDQLRTYYEYLSETIISNIKELVAQANINKQKITVLCTGGGAYNKFLIHLLNQTNSLEFIVPLPQIVQFKQAIIFALLGFKNLQNIQNCSTGVGGVFVRGGTVLQK